MFCKRSSSGERILTVYECHCDRVFSDPIAYQGVDFDQIAKRQIVLIKLLVKRQTHSYF